MPSIPHLVFPLCFPLKDPMTLRLPYDFSLQMTVMYVELTT